MKIAPLKIWVGGGVGGGGAGTIFRSHLFMLIQLWNARGGKD